MRIKRYVELQDMNNEDNWTNKVDIYGYDDEVTVWGHGFVRTYKTKNLEETKVVMLDIINKILDLDFKIINQEVR